MFPRALVEFFVLALSDAGDVVFDPFLGKRNDDGCCGVILALGRFSLPN